MHRNKGELRKKIINILFIPKSFIATPRIHGPHYVCLQDKNSANLVMVHV